MKRNNRLNRILSLALVFAMIVSIIPSSAAKAATTTPNWDSITDWKEITCSGDASGNPLTAPINFDSTCGAYKTFSVPVDNKAYYKKVANGHYYFKLVGNNTIKLTITSATYPTLTITNFSPYNSQSTPYTTYLELKNKELFLIEGACQSGLLAFTCGDNIYRIQCEDIKHAEDATVYKASDNICIIDLPPVQSDAGDLARTSTSIKFSKLTPNASNDGYVSADLTTQTNSITTSGTEEIRNTNRYYVDANLADATEFSTEKQTAILAQWDAARTAKTTAISENSTAATAAITGAANVTDEQKTLANTAVSDICKDAISISSNATIATQLEQADNMNKKISLIKDIITTASETNKLIDSLAALSDSEKAAFKAECTAAAQKAIVSVKSAPATNAGIVSNTAYTNKDLKLSLLDTTANATKAALSNTAKSSKTGIDNMKDLSDSEKRVRKDSITTSVNTTSDAIDNAVKEAKRAIEGQKENDDKKKYTKPYEQFPPMDITKTDAVNAEITKGTATIEKLKTDCLASIDSLMKVADTTNKNTSDKTEQNAVSFIKDSMTDDNGKPISTITDATVIRILTGELVWNKLDQETKNQINNMAKNSGAKSFESLLAEAKKVSKDAGDVGNNYDVGTIPFCVSGVSTKATALKWEKVDGVDGYLVYSNVCSANEKKNKPKLVKTITSSNITECTISKRKKNKWYKYRVVAYKTINNTKTPVSKSLLIHVCNAKKDFKYTDPSEITVNKKAVTLKINKTATIKSKVKIPKGKVLKKHGVQTRYIVSDSSIATVSKKGKIKAKKAGTCTVYVCAQNGMYKTVTVTVK